FTLLTMNLALNRSIQKGGCQLLGLNKHSVYQWLKTIDTIIFDGDGVLWSHDRPLKGAAETFNALRGMGKNAYICTNNSTQSVAGISRKAQGMGLLVSSKEILSSGQALAKFMKERKFKRKAYVIGGQGIVDELKLVGIESLPLDPPTLTKLSRSKPGEEIILDPHVGAVVVGMDKDFNANKLAKAASYLKDPEVMFVATNRDRSFPVAPGRVIPGAGIMVAAIQATCLRAPFSCGKPNPYLCIDLRRQGHIQAERTLMVGDTMYTDVKFGYNCGFQTLLVGSGVSSYKDALEAQDSKDPFMYQQVPDLFVPKLSDILPFLPSRNVHFY
ncbi:hypothetical protein KR009_011173, partial [Drosophila setifemur]